MYDEERQTDELLALENIYTREEFKTLKESGQLGGRFHAFIVFENELKLFFKDLRKPESCFQELLLHHLPPLVLLFSFPKDYPSSSPPDFTLSSRWLLRKDIAKLCRKLDAIWDENSGMEIMYIWTQFLKEEALRFLGMNEELNISERYTHYLRCMETWGMCNLEEGGTEKGIEEGGVEEDQLKNAIEEDQVKNAMEENQLKVVTEETGVEKAMEKDVEKVSKGDNNCSEPPIFFAHKVLVVDMDNSVENHICAVEQCEEGKCSLQGAMQNCCRNTKPLEHNSAGPSWRRFSPENVQSTKETGYNRRYRSSRELKGGENKQNLLSQKRLEPSKDNDTNKVDTATCNTTCDMSRTEMKDTLNESNKNGDLGSKFCRRQGTNHVAETKLNNHHHCSSKADHTVVNELRKSDTRSELVCVNVNTNSARGKGDVRQRRNARKPKNSSHTEQENQARHLRAECKKHEDLDKRAIVGLHPRMSIIQYLVDYNSKQTKLQFERSFHTCKICFEDKLGVYCMKFEPCRHVFCSDCITNYFEVRIMEGTVLSIPCPEDKCPSEAQPSDVRALVSPEMYTKYDSILLSAVLDTQPDLVYCPRRQCQYPVIHEDKTDKLATCPECNYAFCVLCRKVYHGVAPCAIAPGKLQVVGEVEILPEEELKLVEEYMAARNEKKKAMEAKYGKQQLMNLLYIFHLEWSESWIKKNSQKCPQCRVDIEKSSGCNKIWCWKCGTLFCWVCNTRLDKQKPYDHFDRSDSPCFNNLWETVVIEEQIFGNDEE